MTKVASESLNDAGRSDDRTRRRVLHLLTGRTFGGAEEHALSILTAIREYGFEPCLAAPAALIAAMEPRLSAAGVKCLPLEFSSRLDVLTGARLMRFLRRENIAILHCHLFTASLFGAGVARMAGVGSVLETCHGPEVWRMGKGLRASFWVDRQVGRMVDKYIAVSHAAERHLVGNKRVPKNKIRVIHNGRDLDRFAPANANRRIATRAALGTRRRTGDPHDGAAGRSERASASDRCARDCRAAAARPRHASGRRGSAREIACARNARRWGLAERVRFLGYRRDVPELFEAADIVVLPSLYEGLPLVAIEALAAGRPMVATEVDGTPEVVIHEQTGLLVPPANPVALAAAIERLLDEPELAARLASDGRKFVHENFAVQRQIEQTAALYSELTGLGREGEAA